MNDESPLLLAETQREAVGIIKDVNRPLVDIAQNSDIKQGSDDIVTYRGTTISPSVQKKMPIFESTHEDDVMFFGDSNTTELRPTTRTSLDQAGLHRGYISTLPYPKNRKRHSETFTARASHLSHNSPPTRNSALVENSEYSEPTSLTDRVYTTAAVVAASVAAGVASFFTTQKSYDEDSICDNDHDVYDPYMTKDNEPRTESQDHLLNNSQSADDHPPVNKPSIVEEDHVNHQLAKEVPQSPETPSYDVDVTDPSTEIQESPLIHDQQPSENKELSEEVARPSTNHATVVPVYSNNIPIDSHIQQAKSLEPPPATLRIDAVESISSTRAIADGMVPAPANLSEPKRKTTLSKDLKNRTSALASAFRRLSLKEEGTRTGGHTRKLSDAEIFKNQMLQKQTSIHPASVVQTEPKERRAGELERASQDHLRYTGVGKKNARIPGIYSLSPTEEKEFKGGIFSSHLERRRGSIQVGIFYIDMKHV